MPAQVRDNGDHTFRVEFAPRSAGEHRIHVAYGSEAIPGSPFSCKVYDVAAIKVRPADRGMVAKPVTFLGEHRASLTFNICSDMLYSPIGV